MTGSRGTVWKRDHSVHADGDTVPLPRPTPRPEVRGTPRPNANRPARGRAPAGLVLTRARAILPGLWDCFYAAAGSGSEPFAAAPVAVTSGSTSGGPPATESAGCVAASPGALMPTAS